MQPPSNPASAQKLTLPSLRRRFASMAYECLLLFGVLSLTFLVPHLLLGIAASTVLPGWALLLHVFIVLGAYFIGYWHFGGQTLAMQTWQLQIVTEDYARPTPARLVLRYLLAVPSIIYFGTGLLWALWDRDRQFLHDRLAKTRIVLKPKHEQATGSN
ncbi:MAG: RDD family protein [Rugosibacter sp.]|nr:RDD family protein [Rugosibacter sp.]